MDTSPTSPQPTTPHTTTRVVVTTIDYLAGIVGVVLVIGLVAAVLLQRDVPAVLVVLVGQIVTYYFGRAARA